MTQSSIKAPGGASTFTLTQEQEEAIEAGCVPKGPSLMLNAYAGCAKTSTLKLMAQAKAQAGDRGSAMALAFNKKIAKELEAALPPHYEVRSFNALGHRAWGAKLGGRLTLDDKKLGRITSQVLKDQDRAWPEETWDEVRRLTSQAMALGLKHQAFSDTEGLIPDDLEVWADIAEDLYILPQTETLLLAREVLARSTKEALGGIISFDDQIYMSSLFGGLFPRVGHVIVDEYQDLNPLNILMLRKVAGGRIWAAGDRLQSIYHFRGADSEAQAKIRALKPEWRDLSLTLTFRCPKVVVERQQYHARGFQAAPTNAQGSFQLFRPPLAPGPKPWSWTWSQIPPGEVGIICRNNAPLMSMAFQLIRQQVGVTMLGREIGKGLLALSKKLFPGDATPSDQCFGQVASWVEKETREAQAKGHEEKISGITDRAECLYAVLESGGVATAGDLRSRLEFLFSQENALVTLGTIHKFKGLERKTVIFLDHWRIPSRKALAQGGVELEQELNLAYVAETRAKENLILASLEDFT